MIAKKHIITGFNRGAETYTEAAHLQAKVARNLSHQLCHITAENILEIGCGTGLLTQHLVQAFPKAHFMLTDISPSMIEQCRNRMKGLSNTNWACVDGEHLDKSPFFDLIVSSMTFHWFKELDVSLTNIKQKLKKGGRLVFAMLTENSLREWRDMCNHFNYPIATIHFPSVTRLKKQFPQLKLHTEVIRETYSNTYAFLKTLKLLGATAAREGYTQLTSNKMRKLIRHFDREIEITYEVVYGEYINNNHIVTTQPQALLHKSKLEND